MILYYLLWMKRNDDLYQKYLALEDAHRQSEAKHADILGRRTEAESQLQAQETGTPEGDRKFEELRKNYDAIDSQYWDAHKDMGTRSAELESFKQEHDIPSLQMAAGQQQEEVSAQYKSMSGNEGAMTSTDVNSMYSSYHAAAAPQKSLSDPEFDALKESIDKDNPLKDVSTADAIMSKYDDNSPFGSGKNQEADLAKDDPTVGKGATDDQHDPMAKYNDTPPAEAPDSQKENDLDSPAHDPTDDLE